MQPKQMRDTRKSEFPNFTYSITQMTYSFKDTKIQKLTVVSIEENEKMWRFGEPPMLFF
jgi:hypothetical protein